MGEVFLAERADAEFEQQVAIKVVHGGTTSRGVHSRLKIERQILAQLDHPNIAHLMDGGSLPDGTAYIVMEYVDGLPIDTFCDSNRLDLVGRHWSGGPDRSGHLTRAKTDRRVSSSEPTCQGVGG